MLWVAVVAALVVVRLWWVWPRRTRSQRPLLSSCKLMAVLGSGGHTSELLPVVRSLGPSYAPRVYVAADDRSVARAVAEEEGKKKVGSFTTVLIPRARHVGQSYVSSVATTLWALLWSVAVVLRERPRLILCNGPAICVPIAVAALLLRFLGGRVDVVFIESGCRVDRLSLAGTIMWRLSLCDAFMVQWEKLQALYPGTHYVGRTL